MLDRPKILAGVTRKDGVPMWYSAKSQKGNNEKFLGFPFWDFAEYHIGTPSFRVTRAKNPKDIFIFYLILFSEMCPRHLRHSL